MHMGKENPIDKGPILVTGASSGIGESTAKYLAKNGYPVYAGVRKQIDYSRLEKYENIFPVILDVTSDEDIDNAVKIVCEKGLGLSGLVNNAGIAVAGPLMDVDPSEFSKQFEVNVIGLHKITKAFFPMIVKSKGRIIMISSDSGFFATPFFGPYCSSKFAVEGYADSLRRELLMTDVKVVIIQPGRITTKIWEKGERFLDMYQNSMFAEKAKEVGEYAIRKGKTDGLDPVEVAILIKNILEDSDPKTRYLIAPSTFKYRLIKMLPDKMVDKMVKKELE